MLQGRSRSSSSAKPGASVQGGGVNRGSASPLSQSALEEDGGKGSGSVIVTPRRPLGTPSGLHPQQRPAQALQQQQQQHSKGAEQDEAPLDDRAAAKGMLPPPIITTLSMRAASGAGTVVAAAGKPAAADEAERRQRWWSPSAWLPLRRRREKRKEGEGEEEVGLEGSVHRHGHGGEHGVMADEARERELLDGWMGARG